MRTLIVLLVLTACGSPKLFVESDTQWDGHIAGESGSGSSYEGSGNWSIKLNHGRTCWNFQKDTEDGYLRAYVKTPGIFGSDTQGDARTTAAYGVVSGCAE